MEDTIEVATEIEHAPGAPPKRTRRSWFKLRGFSPRVVWLITRRTTRDFMTDRCTQMAAAIAYSVLFAIIPVVALAVAAFGLFLRIPEIRQVVVERILENLPVRAGLVVDAIRGVSTASQPLTIVGVVGLVWAALGMFGAVRDALNVAWGVRKGRNPFRQKLFDLASFVVLGLLFVGSILGTMALHALQDASARALGSHSGQIQFLWVTTGWAFPALVTFVAFLFLYRYVPNVRHGMGDVWPGALAATLLFEAAKHAFTWYVASFNRFELVYGALGAVMLFLLWVYVSAVILLIGAEMASVYEKALRGRTTASRPHPDLVLRPSPPAGA